MNNNKALVKIEKVYGKTRYSVVIQECWSLNNMCELLDDEGDPIEDLFDIEIVTYENSEGIIEVRNFENDQSVILGKEDIELLAKISQMSAVEHN